MKIIKFILLLAIISFCYTKNHCLEVKKECLFYRSTVEHCLYGYGNICRKCEDNYSLSNDMTKCINVSNCIEFDENEKCEICDLYNNFDSNGNCVKDYCQIYQIDNNGNSRCIQCYGGFILNNEDQCEKINITNCDYIENNVCTNCFLGYELENGKCIQRNFIEGCATYNNDGTCKECYSYYTLNNGKCTFNNECEGSNLYEVCLSCEEGYYLNTVYFNCKSINGTKDEDLSSNENSSSNGINDNLAKGITFNFALICLFLALI